MTWYIVFCYFVAIATSTYIIQIAPEFWTNTDNLGTIVLGSLFTPITVTIAFTILPIWYLIKFLRYRKILP